ncbi:MAG: ribosome-binding factor A [Patescibacteria group bacterium]
MLFNNKNKNERLKEEIHRAAARFLLEESNHRSLITITRTDLSEHAERMMIFLSVLPEEAEEEALEFSNRKRGELKKYLSQNFRLSRIPFIQFIIDRGEKNRQRLDEITKSD